MTFTPVQPEIIRQIDEVVEQRNLLKHPFYQAWSAGTLTLDALREYARQYWHFARAFPQFVSAAHAVCPDLDDRRALLENLIEEERGADNHPELWLRFGEALGLTRDEMIASEPLPETAALVETYRTLTRGDFLDAAVALYSYESQVPAIATTKIDGLRRFYSIDDERATAFFSVHVGADAGHAATGREMIARNAAGADEHAVAVATAATDALNGMLTGVHGRFVVC